MTNPHRPSIGQVRSLARACALAGALAMGPLMALAAVPFTATLLPADAPASLASGITLPDAFVTPVVRNVAGDMAGTITRRSYDEVFQAGPFNPASPNLDSYRYLSTSGTASEGRWANYLSVAREAYVTEGGQLRRLGTGGFGESTASFINDRGQVAGDLFDRHVSVQLDHRGARADNTQLSGLAENRVRQHAFLYEQGTLKDLGTLGGTRSGVNALNARGDVLGWSLLEGDNAVQAFIYRGGQMVALGAPGQSSHATLLNDQGTVVGGTNSGAMVYQDGVLHDLGKLGGTYAEATLLSPQSVVAGTVMDWANNSRGVFVYKDGVSTLLPQMLSEDGGAMSMFATAINDRGDVAGFAFSDSYEDFRAFVYRDGEMIDLSGLVPTQNGFPMFGNPMSIGNDGVITFSNGTSKLLLTPSVVPEPASTASMLMGLAAMLGAMRLKRRC